MRCLACKLELQPSEAMRVDGKTDTGDSTFYIHRPSLDGRCFNQVVFGGHLISLVELSTFESVPMGGKTVPYRCPICVGGDYYGKLMFEGDVLNEMSSLVCPNHGRDKEGSSIVIELVPSKGFVEKETGFVVSNLSDYDGVRAAKGL